MQGWEWIVVAAVVLVLFGGTQIPKLARSLGQAQKEFKQGLKDGATEDADGKTIESTTIESKTTETKPAE